MGCEAISMAMFLQTRIGLSRSVGYLKFMGKSWGCTYPIFHSPNKMILKMRMFKTRRDNQWFLHKYHMLLSISNVELPSGKLT